MKFICVLISCYVLLLSANPCCAAYNCTEKVTLKSEVSHKETTEQQECPGCSPFFSCGSCIGFIVAEQVATILPTLSYTERKVFQGYLQSKPQEIYDSIWQPPKLG